MAFNLSNASNVLKVFYLPPIREQLNQQSILWSRISKDSTTQVQGKSFTVPLHTSRNQSAGIGIDDGGTLPTAGQQGYSTAVIPNKYVYGRIEVTGPTIRATQSDAGAFIRAVRGEIEGCTLDFTSALNRQLHSDGRDALAFWTTTDTSSGTNVDDGQGNAFIHLISGATYDLLDTDHTTVNGNNLVVTVGAEGANDWAITWTGTVSAGDDGDYLVPKDSEGWQMMGIRGVIASGDPPNIGGKLANGLHGLAVASNSFWKAQVVTGSSAGTNEDLTLARMQKPLSRIVVNSNFRDKDVAFMLCNTYVKDKYVELLVADKRHVNEMELDGGHSAVSFNNKPMVIDPQCRRNVIYYVNPKTMRIYRTSDIDWADFDGSIFSRVANQDSWEAFIFHYGDLGCSARNGNGLLEDISE